MSNYQENFISHNSSVMAKYGANFVVKNTRQRLDSVSKNELLALSKSAHEKQSLESFVFIDEKHSNLRHE
jgi:hypothetical protein